MSRVSYWRWLPVVLVNVVMLTAACGGGVDAAGSGMPTSAPTSTDRPESAARDETVSQRCTGERGTGRSRVVAAKGSKLAAAELGRGPTWAVFLHQTNGDGLCGWWPYATRVARQGVHVLLLDLCGYGRSTCIDPLGDDQVGQATAAVAYARRHGAQRVAVVGASMGGAVALPSALASQADAVVDLSGPPDWPGTRLTEDAKALTMPTLLAVSPEDPLSVQAFRRAIRQVPATTKKLEILPGGHGYVMLGYPGNWSQLAALVRRWIVGDYS